MSFPMPGRIVAFDTEGTGLNPRGDSRRILYRFGPPKAPEYVARSVVTARPFAYSFCNRDGQTKYVRGVVDPITRGVTFKRSQRQEIDDILLDERITKIAHNGRYDIGVGEAQGFEFRGELIDTQILAHVHTAGAELTYALKPLSKKFLQYSDADEKALSLSTTRARMIARKARWSYATEALGGKTPAKADYWMADHEVCETYAVHDAIRTMALYRFWIDELRADPKRYSVFQREHELFWVLKRMEDRGARVFPEDVRRLKKFYQRYQRVQTKVAVANGGAGMNYGSTPQMSKKFYEDRGHAPRFTGTFNQKLGRYNYSLTGEDLLKMSVGYDIELSDIQKDQLRKLKAWNGGTVVGDLVRVKPDPLAKAVLEYKAADQTISSFLDIYERYWVRKKLKWSKRNARRVDRAIYLLHTSYRQTGAKTGRLSASDPNMMQVASETTGRRKADIQSRPREAFGPRPGHVWYLPDYSQIEVWLFAFMSGEKRMQKALLSGQDYHGGIAKQVFGKRADYAEHEDYYRKCAKLIMFAKLYGGGVAKLAGLLRMPFHLAKEFIDQYEASLPGVAQFMEKMIAFAEEFGEIENPYGRRYVFDRGFEYRATNYIIQGTAADVMKNAMIYVDRMLRKKWGGVPRLILTIHDELVIEVPLRLHSRALMYDIVRAMQQDTKILGLPVPLPVDMKFATKRWAWTTKVTLPPEIRGGCLAAAA